MRAVVTEPTLERAWSADSRDSSILAEMKRLFAVIRTRGRAWNGSRSLEDQHEWQAHAAFMNRLESEGFVVLGGVLEGTPDVLLIVRAEDEDEVHARLAADPWTQKDLLRVTKAVPWTLRLGSLVDGPASKL